MRAAVLYSTLGSLTLTALAMAPAAANATFSPTPTPASSPEQRGVATAAQRAAEAGISFSACAAEEGLQDPARCGTVKVPLDYAHPNGKQLSLTISRSQAPGPRAERLGALVFNPGGPGGSGTYFPLLRDLPEFSKIGAAYDFVGYAPRGVASSGGLSCVNPESFMKAPSDSPPHPSESEKQRRITEAKAYAAGCAKNPGIAHYTSLNNARDLEVLRAALGEKKLNFLGASYGTYFGALYATLHPERVGRFVFDSAVDPTPGSIWYINNLVQSGAFEARWADWQKWVAKHDETYHLGRSAWQVAQSYEKARKSVEQEPAGERVGTAQLQAAFLKTGYADDYWPIAAAALSEYLEGKPQALIDFAAIAPEEYAAEENGNAVYTAVECNDAPWPTEWKQWDRDNSELARRAPFETWENVWMNLPCAYWTAPRQQPVDIRTGPDELPPLLILAAERDAATPYQGAQELQRRLAGSTLITERDAGSHGISGGPNACVNEHVDAFLLKGSTPGSAAECAPHAEPEPAPKPAAGK